MKNERKLNSLLYRVPFCSAFFPFPFLPYVYAYSCTYAQDSQKQKKTEAKEERNQVSSTNTVAETLSTGGKGKK